MKIGVVGLGKIGLPLAAQYALRGHDVIGIDVDDRVVRAVNSGEVPFPGEHGLAEALQRLAPTGKLRATGDSTAAVPSCDVIVVVVPLFVDDEGVPDFGWMDAATDAIGASLTPDTLVLYETTLPVGTTRERWAPRLEARSGLRQGSDFHVAFSPERVLTGRVFADLRRYPKLVGGLTPAGTARAVDFYRAVLEFDERDDLPRANGVWDLGSAEAAEMAKLAETTYRDVNIGLANEFAAFAERVGVDVEQVIEACNSQPYSHLHRPGIAVGGHCIPVYPRLYLWNDPGASIVRAARERNTAMPEHAVAVLSGLAGGLEGATVLVLGASYRGGVKETAFSGVFPTVEALRARGALVLVHDPMYTDAELEQLGFVPARRGVAADAVVVQSDHDEYASWSAADVPGVRAVLDGRRVLDAAAWPCSFAVLGAPPRA
ncbi:nucleotide sugar dehydrogenase [Curtobacterium sp. MCPF17_047]|uniref:nucleotide sugar dehydrogenase n=1 Tax=unclassified Curtobacterium TaxID=257496 RepID=UPI000DA9C7E8|nr:MULTISPECIES: nucleotide sugar dehydrogenase [unclassified Curtobacterium]PZE61522.1 nucleotide sugar dehydrogenase [Curtobacterium sp. MCPF17_001]PZF67026.1 nucleotide sugar dehydrogenase [Curtobacterium sp. MCPF17_047]